MKFNHRPRMFWCCATLFCVISTPLLVVAQQSQATAALQVRAHIVHSFRAPQGVSVPAQTNGITLPSQRPVIPQHIESDDLCQSRWRTEPAVCTSQTTLSNSAPATITLVTRVFLP